MKKIGLLLLILLTLVSCKTKEKGPQDVDIYMPDGTPALALASVLDQGFSYQETKTKFHIVQASEIAARVSQDSCDLAIMPTTAAATLFSKGIQLQLASVNVFGNLYIVGTKEIQSLSDLKGKVVYTTAATTIQMVEYVLNKNNVAFTEGAQTEENKVTLTSKNDASEIIPLLKKASLSGEEVYGVLGEPQVTQAQKNITGLKIAVDLQKEYQNITQQEGYPQACLVVKNSFSGQYPNYVKTLLKTLEKNGKYLDEHVDSLPEVFKKYDSNLQNLSFTKETIERCHLRLEVAEDVKQSVMDYVKELGKIELNDQFFYI